MGAGPRLGALRRNENEEGQPSSAPFIHLPSWFIARTGDAEPFSCVICGWNCQADLFMKSHV
jgi:hypothetical protein